MFDCLLGIAELNLNLTNEECKELVFIVEHMWLHSAPWKKVAREHDQINGYFARWRSNCYDDLKRALVSMMSGIDRLNVSAILH